jgi:hypothetical protein
MNLVSSHQSVDQPIAATDDELAQPRIVALRNDASTHGELTQRPNAFEEKQGRYDNACMTPLHPANLTPCGLQ